VIAALLEDPKLRATHAGLKAGFQSQQMGINWVKRFNQEGLAGLEDKPKSGRPPIHDQKVHT
jgi:transposase